MACMRAEGGYTITATLSYSRRNRCSCNAASAIALAAYPGVKSMKSVRGNAQSAWFFEEAVTMCAECMIIDRCNARLKLSCFEENDVMTAHPGTGRSKEVCESDASRLPYGSAAEQAVRREKQSASTGPCSRAYTCLGDKAGCAASHERNLHKQNALQAAPSA